MTALPPALLVATLVWIVLLFAQLAELVASSAELRAAGIGSQGGRARTSVLGAEAAALVVVAAVFGVEVAARQILDGAVLLGTILLVVIAFALGAGLVGLAVAVNRPGRDGYPAIGADIADLAGNRVTKADVAALRAALTAVDERHPEVRWPGAWRALFRAGWRLVPTAVGILLFLATILVVGIEAAWSSWWLVPVAVLPPVGSTVLAFAATRARFAERVAWNRVYSAQRSTVAAELDQLDRRAGRGVAGLTERVTRALSILREQPQTKEQR